MISDMILIANLIKHLFISYFILHGIFCGTWEILAHLPVTIFIITALLVLIQCLKLPAPPFLVVEDIIGRDLCYENELSRCRQMKTVAHRGAALDAPENSLEGFQMCLDKGITFVEFDVMLTADNVPVVFHDHDLERLTGSLSKVSEITYEQLSEFDISVKHAFGHTYTNVKVPTLQQVVGQLLSSGQSMFIDVKDSNNKIIAYILNLFEQHPELYCKAVVSSFFPQIIYKIRKSDPGIVCSLAWRPHVFTLESYNGLSSISGQRRNSSIFKHYLNIFLDIVYEYAFTKVVYSFLGISLVLLHKDCISSKVVSDWRKKGIRVVAWTVNSPTEKQYFARILKIAYMTDTLTAENTTHFALN